MANRYIETRILLPVVGKSISISKVSTFDSDYSTHIIQYVPLTLRQYLPFKGHTWWRNKYFLCHGELLFCVHAASQRWQCLIRTPSSTWIRAEPFVCAHCYNLSHLLKLKTTCSSLAQDYGPTAALYVVVHLLPLAVWRAAADTNFIWYFIHRCVGWAHTSA